MLENPVWGLVEGAFLGVLTVKENEPVLEIKVFNLADKVYPLPPQVIDPILVPGTHD